MTRARKPRRRARPPVRKRASRATPRTTEAEARLLTLARELAGVPLEAVVRRLAAAHGPAAPLPGAVFQVWLRSRGDKASGLALAWAREQVRLALRDALNQVGTASGARGRLGLDDDALAWILLAAVESLAHEPPAAVADRLRVILALAAPDA